MPGGRAAFRPRVPPALLAGSGHWHVAGIISAQPWPAGSFPGPARRPVHSLPWGHLHWPRAGLGSGPIGARAWGAKATVPPTGACPARGLRARAAPGMGMVLPRLGSGLQRGGRTAHPAQPGSGCRGCWLWGAVGCTRVSPIILPFTGSPALLAATGASPGCASSPRSGVRRLWVVQGAVGTRGVRRSGTGEGMRGYRGYVWGVLGHSRGLKRGAPRGSCVSSRRFTGGTSEGSWGADGGLNGGVQSGVQKGITRAILGAPRSVQRGLDVGRRGR